MRNYSISSRIFLLLSLSLIIGCSPFQEEAALDGVTELEYTEPGVLQQNSVEPNRLVSGNLSLEIQEELSTGVKTLFASATFHEPVAKNILFADINTGLLSKNIYKPKPAEEEPCGIPGFPDCPEPSPSPNP